jgi:hypothetical protein
MLKQAATVAARRQNAASATHTHTAAAGGSSKSAFRIHTQLHENDKIGHFAAGQYAGFGAAPGRQLLQ